MNKVRCVAVAVLFSITIFFCGTNRALALDEPILLDENKTFTDDVSLNVDSDHLELTIGQTWYGLEGAFGVHADRNDNETSVAVEMAPGKKVNIVFADDHITQKKGILVDNVKFFSDRKPGGPVSAHFGTVNIDKAAYGLYAEGNNVSVNADSATITDARINAVYAEAGAIVTIGDNAVLKMDENIRPYADPEHGYQDQDAGTIAARGILNNGKRIEGAKIVIGNNALIENHSNVIQINSRAINCDFGTVIVGDNAKISSYIAPNADAEAYWNHAVVAEGRRRDGGRTSVTIGRDAEISTAGRKSYGLYAHASGDITLGADSTVTTERDESHAVYAVYENAPWDDVDGGFISLADGVVVTTKGDASNGIYAAASSDIVAGNGLTVDTSGEGSSGLRADSHGTVATGRGAVIETAGKGSHGVYAWNYGFVNIGEDANIHTGGEGADGLFSIYGGTVAAAGGARIQVDGKDAYGVLADLGGEVTLSGAQTISSTFDGNAYAIGAYNNDQEGWHGVVSSVRADGVLNVAGGIQAGSYGDVDLTYQAGSTLSGFTEQSGEGSNLTMRMAASTWNMTKSSNLSELDLAESSVVDFGGGDFKTLTTQKLGADAAGGEFRMKTDIVQEKADLLKVTGESAGAHGITVANSGGAKTTGKEIVPLVDTSDGTATFKLRNKGESVSLGGFAYTLGRYGDGTDWVLSSSGKPSPGTDGAVNTFTGAYLLAYAETDTLIKRLGDLRTTYTDDGYWFRAYGGKFESDSRSFVQGFDMDYGGLQVGYDHRLERENSWIKGGDTYVGGFIAYGRGDLDYSTEYGGTGGSGTVDSRTMGMYGTYIGDDGIYADMIVKYMWMKNKFDVLDTDGARVTGGHVQTGGVGASLELGKRVHFKGKQEKGWYVEPQIQLSYQHQDGGYFNASNGLRVGVDSFNSLIGRAGALIGFENEKTNLYVKASYLKEFDGDVNIYANSVPVGESYGDEWWVYGLGVTSVLDEKNSLYFDVERADGGKFSQPWVVNAGWRINF